jgi:hypothetical protein
MNWKGKSCKLIVSVQTSERDMTIKYEVAYVNDIAIDIKSDSEDSFDKF